MTETDTKIAAMTAGWDIAAADAVDWVPWGGDGRARAKVLAAGDGYTMVLVEAQAGYVGAEHEHTHTEFGYVLTGEIRNQGQVLTAGAAFVAQAGSQHTDFEVLAPATYLTVFKL